MKRRVKVCHLTSVHARFDSRIFQKECVSLRNDYEMNLIVADGLPDQEVKGIKIIGISKPKNKLRRILSTTKEIFDKAKILDVDIYHFHDPELIFTGLKLKKLGKKVIFDIHEDMIEQIMIRPWIPFFLRKSIGVVYDKIEKRNLNKFDALIVPQYFMVDRYSKLNKKVEVVENFVILNRIEQKDKTNSDNKITFFHAGSLNKERGLLNMINFIKHAPSNYFLYLAGNADQGSIEEINKLSSKYNIKYLGILNKEELDKFYKKTDFGLILSNNVGQYHRSFSIKLFEYMSYGIPIVMPNFGDWLPFNRENECGVNVDPTNYKEIIDSIENLIKDSNLRNKYSFNANEAVHNKYNWKIAEKKLLNLYKEIDNTEKV